MQNVDFSRVPEFYHKYIRRVSDLAIAEAMEQHQHHLLPLLSSISDAKWDYRYAEDKWSIKGLVQHIIDAERIFCFRALTIARKDRKPLPGFDENSYAESSRAFKRQSKELLDELTIVQKSSAALFNSFDEEQLNEQGIANGNPVYVGAIGYIIVGHSLHHKSILEQRYLK